MVGCTTSKRMISEEDRRLKEIEDRYQEIIRKADSCFENKQWEQAKALYTQAYHIKPNNYPEDQIKIISAEESTEFYRSQRKQCERMVLRADEYVLKKEYERAIRIYDSVLSACYKHPKDSIEIKNLKLKIEEVRVLKLK